MSNPPKIEDILTQMSQIFMKIGIFVYCDAQLQYLKI